MIESNFEKGNTIGLDFGTGSILYYDLSMAAPSLISTSSPATINGNQNSPSTSVSLYPCGWLRPLPKGMQAPAQRSDMPVTSKYPELCAKINRYIDSGRMDRTKVLEIIKKVNASK